MTNFPNQPKIKSVPKLNQFNVIDKLVNTQQLIFVYVKAQLRTDFANSKASTPGHTICNREREVVKRASLLSQDLLRLNTPLMAEINTSTERHYPNPNQKTKKGERDSKSKKEKHPELRTGHD